MNGPKFIKLRGLPLGNETEMWVNADTFISVRPPVEGLDYFKLNVAAGDPKPGAVIQFMQSGQHQVIETPEQILALIEEAGKP